MELSVMFVAAHPDDEIFGIAGSIALHRDDPGMRFTLVHATDGDAGEIAPDVDVDPSRLGAHRRLEDVESWAIVGRPPDRHEWLDFRDGTLERHHEELADRIAGILREERPRVVATLGPDGVTGHPDHIAISAATTQAFRRVAAEGVPLERLIYGAVPQSSIDDWNERAAASGRGQWDPTKPFHLRGVPDETIGISVDTSSVTETLIRALRAHRSQWSYMTMDDDNALATGLQRETWVIAEPATPPGLLLHDIFQPLEA